MLPPHVLRERQRKVSHFTSMCCCAKGTALQAAVLEKPLVTLVTLPGSHPNHHKKTTTTLHQLLALFVLQAQGRSSKRCVTEVESSNIVSNQASFAYDLTNVKPHQHLCGHQTVPQRFLKEKKPQFRIFAPATASFLALVIKHHA